VLVSASGDTATVIRFWEVATGKELGEPLTDHRVFVSDMRFTPDGKTLATASGDQTIRLWDVSDPTHARLEGPPLRGHTLEVLCLAWRPDTRTLVSGSKDGEVYLWDLPARRPFDDVVTLNTGFSGRWIFSPDGKAILTYNHEGRVARWQGQEFRDMQVLFTTPTPNLKGGFFSDDGRRFVWGDRDETVRIWDVDNATVIQELTIRPGPASPWEFVDQERKLLLVTEGGRRDRLWDLVSGREVYAWANPPQAFGWAVAPDDRWWVRVSRHGVCSVRNLVTGEATDQHLHIGRAVCIGLSPDGTILAVASWDNHLRLWNTTTWEELKTLRSVLLRYHSVAYSRDGRRLITSSEGEEAIRLWDVETYRELLTLPGRVGAGLFYPGVFSPDGNILGSMSGNGILHLWYAPSWEEIGVAEKARMGDSSGP
jgi:WD40 repeat protein